MRPFACRLALEKFLREIERNQLSWDMIYLGYSSETPVRSTSNIIRLRNPDGLYAHMIKKNVARLLLSEAFPIDMPVDTHYMRVIKDKKLMALGPRGAEFFSVNSKLGSNIREDTYIYPQFLQRKPHPNPFKATVQYLYKALLLA